MLLRGDTRLVSGSSDAELRVWALNFKDIEKEVEVNKEKEEEDADGPPSKMFRLDTEGEVKAKEEDEEIKDDAVSVFKRPKTLDLFTVSLDSLVKKWCQLSFTLIEVSLQVLILVWDLTRHMHRGGYRGLSPLTFLLIL